MKILMILQLIFAILMTISYIIGLVKYFITKDSDYWYTWWLIGLSFYIISTIFWLLQKI